jgi:pimeloyl-ACP methyl ester carboxylesterase
VRFRSIDGLSVRFAESEDRDDHALLLSPRAMGEFIIRAADAFGLEHPHVVGPDIGTAAALFAAALHPGRLPSLVVGSGGAAVPPVNAEFLHDRLPHSKLDLLDAGHFTWEDAPDEYAALVTGWWDGGYATTGTVKRNQESD